MAAVGFSFPTIDARFSPNFKISEVNPRSLQGVKAVFQ